MGEQTLHTPHGSLWVLAWQADSLRAAGELGEVLARDAQPRGERITFGGVGAYLKGGALVGKSRWRHALRGHLLRSRVPRVREYFNLCWLHNRHFQTPLPLAAGVLRRSGLPRYQFLVTRWLAGSRPLEQMLVEEAPRARRGLFEELGREVARMHALGFLHHDLFPRNLLVLGTDWPRRIVFHDAWAGGPGPTLRPPAYDIACLLLDAELLTRQEQGAFLSTYLRTREAQGRPVGGRFLERVQRERAGLLRKLERDPRRLRGRRLPGPWSPPELG